MREKLIDKILEIFNKDKKIIRKNLIKALDEVYIMAEDDYTQVELIIKVSRKKVD